MNNTLLAFEMQRLKSYAKEIQKGTKARGKLVLVIEMEHEDEGVIVVVKSGGVELWKSMIFVIKDGVRVVRCCRRRNGGSTREI
jgi:hypothetical protein